MSADDAAGQARKGLLDTAKGKAKEVFGALSGNDSLTSEGQLLQQQAQDRKEAAGTEAVAHAQAAEAAEQLAEVREAGTEDRAALSAEAATEQAAVRDQQDAERVRAERAGRHEAVAGQANAQARADQQLRQAATEGFAEEAAVTDEAARAVGRHRKLIEEASEAETDAARARRVAEALTDEGGL